MSAATDTAATDTDETPETPPDQDQRFLPLSLAFGMAIAAIGVSGLLDDSGAIPHSPWFAPVAIALAACVAVAVTTARRLF